MKKSRTHPFGSVLSMRCHIQHTFLRARVAPLLTRPLHTQLRLFAGNLFGDITKADPSTQQQVQQEAKSETANTDVLPKDDEVLQKHHMTEALQQQITPAKYVSPLKRALFDANVAANGFFKNGTTVTHEGQSYKFNLTPAEIDILEPSIYLQSFRIKSSTKKATQVNRFVRGFNVKTAINQLHFNPKKMSTELEKLLKTGLVQAREMGLNEDKIYIEQLWTGSDGEWRKRPDCKGRGRAGIMEHPYIHVKAVLRSELTTRRLRWEAAQKASAAKPRMFLNNEPLNFLVRPIYKW